MHFRVFSVLAAPVGTTLLMMALSTDYWEAVFGETVAAHTGLWRTCIRIEQITPQCFALEDPFGYVITARIFLIVASLAAVVLQFFLIATFLPSMCGFLSKPFLASVASFVAGLFTLIALAVYSAETWKQKPPPHLQVTFAWSFYAGWGALPLILSAGILNHFAFLNSPSPGYESL